MNKLYCEECGEQMHAHGGSSMTLVGYFSPPGHDHDDNCICQGYECTNGHIQTVSVIRKCPNCDWTGKKECFCCGQKFNEWPEE
jgi:hypothetical protein